jgi:hypothetical protein
MRRCAGVGVYEGDVQPPGIEIPHTAPTSARRQDCQDLARRVESLVLVRILVQDGPDYLVSLGLAQARHDHDPLFGRATAPDRRMAPLAVTRFMASPLAGGVCYACVRTSTRRRLTRAKKTVYRGARSALRDRQRRGRREARERLRREELSPWSRSAPRSEHPAALPL